MEQKQIAVLMKIIATNYQHQLNKLDSEGYYANLSMFLKDYQYLRVANNLKKHIESSNFIPTIADLVKEDKEEQLRPYIPSALETKERALLLDTKPAIEEEERLSILEEIKKRIKEGKKEHDERINKLIKQ